MKEKEDKNEQRLRIDPPDNMSPGTKRAIDRLIYNAWSAAARWHDGWDGYVNYLDKGWEIVFEVEPPHKGLCDLAESLIDVSSLLCTCAKPYKFSGKITSAPGDCGWRSELRGDASGFILLAVEPEVKEVTMTEVCKKFGCKVKIVEG